MGYFAEIKTICSKNSYSLRIKRMAREISLSNLVIAKQVLNMGSTRLEADTKQSVTTVPDIGRFIDTARSGLERSVGAGFIITIRSPK